MVSRESTNRNTFLLLLLARRWTAAASSSQGEGRIVFLAFSKTGSSTMRQMLGHRAKLSGWARYANGGHNVCHLNRTRDDGVRGRAAQRFADRLSRRTPGHCDDVPDGYVVAASSDRGALALRVLRRSSNHRWPVSRRAVSLPQGRAGCSCSCESRWPERSRAGVTTAGRVPTASHATERRAARAQTLASSNSGTRCHKIHT